MAQSLSSLYVHLVFSTKRREPLLLDSFRESLHRYITGICLSSSSPVVSINSVEDHLHLLIRQGRTVSVAQLVEEVKTGSSRWLTRQKVIWQGWQHGYGAFSVSSSQVSAVSSYIRTQQERHKKSTFEEEFRLLLGAHEIAWDERYLWE